MSNNRDRAALLDMLNAAQKVLQYKAGMDKVAFLDDDKTQSEVARLPKHVLSRSQNLRAS